MSSWYLEFFLNDEKAIHRFPLVRFPFIIGRQEGLSLTLPKASISRMHSRIECLDGLRIVDLLSRNGTFVNQRRIEEPTAIQHGDILHIGDVEMRLIHSAEKAQEPLPDATISMDRDLSKHFPFGVKELEELLETESVALLCQPVVSKGDRSIVGYELQGTATSESLPGDSEALFTIAESAGLEVRLAELVRRKAVEKCVPFCLKHMIFVNTHPSELKDMGAFIDSFREIRERFSAIKLVAEIHERAITDLDSSRLMKKALRSMDVLLAYGGFGVGQSRLLELVEATPHILKFDGMLIRSIDRADHAKLDLVRSLQELSKRLHVKTLL